jgi:hypothetical protein
VKLADKFGRDAAVNEPQAWLLLAFRSLATLCPHFGQHRESNHFPSLLVPKPEAHALQAGKKRYRFDALKQRLSLVAFLQMVIRNARTEVMDVVKTNIS